MAGLKLIAVFEAGKGLLVLLVGLGLLSWVHGDLQSSGERLVSLLHLSPGERFGRIFIKALEDVSRPELVGLAAVAIGYSLLRFIEAFGLWTGRAWGQWIGIVSCAIYLPLELYEIFIHPTGLKLSLTAVNLAVLVYLLGWAAKSRHPPFETPMG